MRVDNLKTENLYGPVGIDSAFPRLSWQIQSSQRGVIQTSYRIVADVDDRIVWDSGRVDASTTSVRWGGESLTSRMRIRWRVMVWTNSEFAVSDPTDFEMGLLAAEDWRARWIVPEQTVDIHGPQPAPILRSTFQVRDGLIRARAYQTAHGLYRSWLNGSPSTESRFNPGFTSYYHRLQYQVDDITALLQPGENVWAAELADGWWRGSTGGSQRNNFGYRVAFLGQLILEYANGDIEFVGSGESFRASTGGLLQSDMKGGDFFDARLEPDGWMRPGFDDSHWHRVSSREYPLDNLIATRSVPVREQERFTPRVLADANGDTILDFGQNIAGYVSMSLAGLRSGQMVSLHHGEQLVDGAFDTRNVNLEAAHIALADARFQQVDYVARGNPREAYCPWASIFGFRYVKVVGYLGEVQPEDFQAIAVYSDLEPVGGFECSNSLLNKLVSNARWSQKGNFLDVPTDCPQRERAPWSGDAQIYAMTATRFMDVQPFFEKWLADLRAEQGPEGLVLNTFPATSAIHNPAEVQRMRRDVLPQDPLAAMLFSAVGEGGILDGSAGWGDAAVILPWTMYLVYGDVQSLREQYGSAKAWVDYMIRASRRRSEVHAEATWYRAESEDDADLIWDTGYHWGEWMEADAVIDQAAFQRMLTHPDPEVPTAYLCYSSRLLGQMATVLGHTDDADHYAAFSDRVKAAFNRHLILPDGTIKPGRQAPYVRALALGLVEDDRRARVVERLVEAIEQAGYHLNTGFLSTAFLLEVLADNGRADLAFRLLEEQTSPSWLAPVIAGATTIPETWTAVQEHSHSHNHYAYGAVCNFLVGHVAGIQPLWSDAGYREFKIEPLLGGTLTQALAYYDSAHGRIVSGWDRTPDGSTHTVQVPANTVAHVRLPDGQHLQLGSGTYTLTSGPVRSE